MICSSSSINCSIDCPPRRPALSCRYIATENSQHAVEGMHANLLIGPVVHRPPSTATRGLPNLFPLDRSKDSRSEEHTSELQSRGHLVCRLLLEKKKITTSVTSNI